MITSRTYRQIIRELNDMTSIEALERRAGELRGQYASDPTWPDISETILSQASALRLEARQRKGARRAAAQPVR